MLITKEIERQLRANHGRDCDNVKPVVKVFNPYGGGTWLFTDMDEDGRLFGLCDLGQGFPELGYVDHAELEGVRVFGTLPLERDRGFKARKTLSEYAAEAKRLGMVQA